jgi:PAS domain-containing protein
VSYHEQLEQQFIELEALGRFMESLLDSVSDTLIVIDRDLRIQEASRSASELFRLSRGAVIGASRHRTPAGAVPVPPWDSDRARGAREGPPGIVEADFLVRGEPSPFEVSVTPRLG